MWDWWDERRYLVDKVTIHYRGSRYEGRGTMSWKPHDGFHIDARLTRYGPPLPHPRTYGPSLTGIEDTRAVRMTLGSGERALVPGLPMLRNYGVIEQGDLNVKAGQAIFCEWPKERGVFLQWYARGLLRVKGYIGLPDPMTREVLVASESVAKSHEVGGIVYRDADCDIQAWYPRDGFIRYECSLHPRYWSRAEAWRWGEALAMALSIMCGETVDLVERDVARGRRMFTEIRAGQEITELAFLSPIPMQPQLSRSGLVDLIGFLCGKSIASGVCARILWQLAEAKRQQTTQGAALLCSTILEAALRTLDGCAFKAEDTSWHLAGSLKRFRARYLGRGWKQTCDRVYETYRALRHRYAHPDWLTVGAGQMTKDSIGETLDQMATLARFYGYMVLALSGTQDMAPDFPESFLRQRIGLTVSDGTDQARAACLEPVAS